MGTSKINILMYADEYLLLIIDTPKGLQNCLSKLCVNLSETKILIIICIKTDTVFTRIEAGFE